MIFDIGPEIQEISSLETGKKRGFWQLCFSPK